jgi:integrase
MNPNKAEIEDEGDNPVFRPVGKRSVEFTRLSDKAVDRIVKRAARAAGLKEGYSAHSLRAGHVTEALARGADRAAIKRQTGHQSDAMLDRYVRETNLAAATVRRGSDCERWPVLAARAYRRERLPPNLRQEDCCQLSRRRA